MTCSIGCCVYPLGSPEDYDWEQVVAVADWALLSAKRAGRNRVLAAGLGPGSDELEARRLIVRDPEAAHHSGFLRLVDAH